MHDRHRQDHPHSPARKPGRKHALGAALLLALALGGCTQQGKDAPAAPAAPQASASALPAGTRLADFAGQEPSADARLMANWVLTTGNAGKHAFVLVDKKEARVYVFTPEGRLRDSTPALMGAARGDTIAPGSGDKPLSQIKPEEKTTPAGRFVAQPGLNAGNEDVIWVDYDDAISMHRIRPLVAQERRLERLASATIDDNRISFGCINLPVTFYEDVAKPIVGKYGAIIYVLPETKTVQELFGAYDVTDPAQVAAAQQQSTLAQAGGKAAAAKPETQG